MKQCFKCLCEKPLDAFYRHAAMADGYLNKCKECAKKDVSEHRAKNIERIRAYDAARASLPHRIELRNRVHREWKEKHPERRAAHMKLLYALRSGAVKRWPCEVCGSEKVEAHHPAYDLPLLVTWLCPPHHKQAHALVRRA